jgi:phage-related protein
VAGPSIIVRIVGDITGLSKSMGDAGKKAEEAGKSLHSTFSGVLSTLNKTGVLGPFGDALATVDEALTKIEEHGKTIGGVLMGAGGALLGIGSAFTAMGDKDKAARQQLEAAIAATGGSWDDYEKQVEQAIVAQEKYGTSAAGTQDALRTLTQATGDPQKALQMLGIASDLAAAKHISLGTAAKQLSKTYGGSTKLLKEFGITTKGTGTEVQDLADKLKGQAAASSDTFTGRLRALKTHIEDVAASFGQKYGPALQTAGVAMTGLGAAIEAGTAVSKVFKEAQIAQAVAENLANAPLLLIVAGIAAIGVAVYLLVTHWSEVWGTIKDVAMAAWDGINAAAEAVFNWFKTNWPLLLGIITGPFGLAVEQIVTHWGDITKGAKEAVDAVTGFFKGVGEKISAPFAAITAAAEATFNWIADHWKLLLGILTGPFGLAVEQIATHWDTIKKGAQQLINDVVGLFTGLPGRISEAVKGVGSSLTGAFSGATDAIGGAFSGAKNTVSNAFGDVKGAVSSAFAGLDLTQTFKDAFSGAKGALSDAFSGAKGILTDAFGGAKGALSSALGGIKGTVTDAFSGAFSGVSGIISSSLKSIKIGDIFASITTDIQGAYHNVSSYWNSIAGLVKGWKAQVGSWLSGLWDNLTKGISSAYHTVAGVWDNISGLVKGWPGQLKGWTSGLWGNITGGLADVYRTVAARFDGIVGYVAGVPARIAASLGGIWDQVTANLASVYSSVAATFNNIIGFIKGVPGRVGAALSGIWSAVTANLSGVYSSVVGMFNNMIGFLRGVPGLIAAALGSPFNFLASQFRGVINTIIRGWNSLHFTLPAFNLGPVHFGGQTIGMPSVPYLQAGGLITQTGFVYAHAGEAITPAPEVGANRNAPAVHIEHLELSEVLDIDVFMKRAAWVAATAGI